jgi:hypothetical protein
MGNNPVIYQRDTATGSFNEPENFAPVAEARVSEQSLYVEDDMGSRTDVFAIYSGTLLGIRRKFRELNRGRIPIYSPYDCTGLLCWQGAKLLKVYRNYAGDYVAIVEVRRSYDV